MSKLSKDKYNELFKLRAEGKLEPMECTKSLFRLLEKIYFENMSILDVPCGTGHYLRKLRNLGKVNYLGIDRDEDALKIAIKIWKDEPNVRFMLGDINKIDLPDNNKDVVYCYNLLLHLADYKDAVAELFRVSKKYIFIRSLFGEKTIIRGSDTPKDYAGIFPEKSYYNSYSRDVITSFVKSLGKCKIKFIDDNLVIPGDLLRKQAEILGTVVSKFTQTNNNKQEWDGIELQYEVMVIEKGA